MEKEPRVMGAGGGNDPSGPEGVNEGVGIIGNGGGDSKVIGGGKE